MRYFSSRGYFGAATAVLWAAEPCLGIRAEPPGQPEVFISQPSRGYSSQAPPQVRCGGELQSLIPEARWDLIPSDDVLQSYGCSHRRKSLGRAVSFIPGETQASSSLKASPSKRHLLCLELELLPRPHVQIHLIHVILAARKEQGPGAWSHFMSPFP